MKPIQDCLNQLKSPGLRIVITTHHQPDADAMGSSIGLAHILQKMGHQVMIVLPNRWAPYLDWLSELASNIITYEEETDRADQAIHNCTYLFAVDYNAFHRTKKMEPLLANAQKQKILIDHHAQPDKERFDYGVSNTKKSSTSEMIYDWANESSLLNYAGEEFRKAIYAGIIGDTGSFAYQSTTSNALQIAATLKEQGLETHLIYQQLFQNNSLKKVRLIGHATSELMTLLGNQQIALIAIPLRTHEQYQLQAGDLEGLVNIPLSIKTVQCSTLVVELPDKKCKWSFRSLGDLNMNRFARTYFNGGGHLNAAGGFSHQSLKEAVDLFKEKIFSIYE